MAFEKEQKILEQAEKDRKPVGPISDLVSGGLVAGGRPRHLRSEHSKTV